jgi:hypothetical protein
MSKPGITLLIFTCRRRGHAGRQSIGAALPLTVDFHELGFVATANGENAFRAQKGFWFQLSGDDRQQAKSPWGPANPHIAILHET